MAIAERKQVEGIENKVEEKFIDFTPEQLEILRMEHEEKIIYTEIMNEDFEDLLNAYRKEHFVSRRDAMNAILKNRLEY